MLMGKGNKLKTPPSAQLNNKKRPMKRYSDPQPKKKMFENSNLNKSNIEDKSPKFNMNKKRSRDDDSDKDDIFDINSDDNDLDEFVVEGDDNSELESSGAENDYEISPKRSKLSKENSVKQAKSVEKSNKPTKEKQLNSNIDEDELYKDLESKASRDKKTLLIRNLKAEINADDVKSLSKDIIDVRINICKGKNTKGKKCAFIEFEDEATTEKNKNLLTGKKLEGADLYIDFVGEKSSKNLPTNKPQDILDPKVLHVSGIKSTVIERDIMKLFPESVKVDLVYSRKDHSRKDFVFVRFADEVKCLQSHKLGQNMMLEGRKLVVQFAKLKSRIDRKNQKKRSREEKKILLRQNGSITKNNVKKQDTPKPNNQGQINVKSNDAKNIKSGSNSQQKMGNTKPDKGQTNAHVSKQNMKNNQKNNQLSKTNNNQGVSVSPKNHQKPSANQVNPKKNKKSNKKNKKPTEKGSGDFIKL